MTLIRTLLCALALSFISQFTSAQSSKEIYQQIKDLSLNSGKAEVNGLLLKRDRGEIKLTGTLYFGGTANGHVTCAVFQGQGNFRADIPPSDVERGYVKRLLNVTDAVSSDFQTAVFRFSDDTMATLGVAKGDGTAPPQLQTLALENDRRLLKETGANIPSRLAVSLLNNESPGFFIATFDGGQRGRFSFALDPSDRLLSDAFDLNAGERGLVFKYDSAFKNNSILMTFYGLEDYAGNRAIYSDANDLIDISKYDMRVDLTDPEKRLQLDADITFRELKKGTRAIPFHIGEVSERARTSG